MYLVPTALLLIFVFSFSSSLINSKYTFDEFVQMVKDNISAAESYDPPSDNGKLAEVEDDDILDYGTFDFVIVGAGSAGTLLANRLSEIPEWKILLIEAGGDENDFTSIPGMAPYLQNTEMNWGYFSIPQTTCCLGMKNKQCVAIRGKVLGGSSVLNGKMYVRGNKKDYDIWARLGNRGWTYKQVLPYFIKTENSSINNGDIGYHGKDGLLHVQYNEPTIFSKLFLNAMEELQVPIVDFNGRSQIGASQSAFTLNGIETASARRAFIDPIRNSRKNLYITLNTLATKILLDDNNKRALGVEFIKRGKKYHVSASKEVILSAGVFNTPQLLLLSGIGPKSELEEHGIKVVHELPVGKYLQDHPSFFGFIVRTNHTAFDESLETSLKNYLHGHRPLTNPMNIDSLRFLRTSLQSTIDSVIPDIQHILVVPPGFQDQYGLTFNLNDEITKSVNNNYNPYTDFMVVVTLLHPKSFGEVTLKSSDPKDFPKIDYRFFSDAEGIDIETMYEGIMEAFKIIETKSFRAVNATFVPIETECGKYRRLARRYWYCVIRHLGSIIYHPVGTTRMGISPSDSVVTPRLKVHGIEQLRVADAGTIPFITSGNINAVVYMIAEKLADIIKMHYKGFE